jgi:hypothetical protein
MHKSRFGVLGTDVGPIRVGGRLYPKGGVALRTAGVKGFSENREPLRGRCFSTMVEG